jgi:hypothetical protein
MVPENKQNTEDTNYLIRLQNNRDPWQLTFGTCE